jgi:hypothetical protein
MIWESPDGKLESGIHKTNALVNVYVRTQHILHILHSIFVCLHFSRGIP